MRGKGRDTHPFQRALLRQAQSLLCDPILGKRRSEILELPPLNTNGAAIISLHTLTHTHPGTEEEAQTHSQVWAACSNQRGKNTI